MEKNILLKRLSIVMLIKAKIVTKSWQILLQVKLHNHSKSLKKSPI